MVCIESISLNYSELTIRVGQKWFTGLKAHLLPEDATCKSVKWSCRNEKVCTVNSRGYISPVAPGTTTVWAETTDGSKKRTHCEVTVIPWTYVEDVSCDDNSIRVTEEGTRILHATIYPADASNQEVIWAATEPIVQLTVDQDNPLFCTVTGKKLGECVVTVTSMEDTDLMGCCRVNVIERVPLEKIEILQPEVAICQDGDAKKLKVNLSPMNTTDTNLKWTSNKPGTVSVDDQGNIVGKQVGSAVITVRNISSGCSAQCKVTVFSPDKKVVIKNDSAFFTITFPSGRVWKSIGCDLSLDENRSKHGNLNNPDSDLNDAERRYMYNSDISYTVAELGHIYRFDPLGLEFYMRQGSKSLNFKDQVYWEIFGKNFGRFYFRLRDNVPEYICKSQAVSASVRDEYYSNAEVLFGFHQSFDFAAFWEKLLKEIFSCLPGVSELKLGMSLCQSMFFGGSFTEVGTDVTAAFVDSYVEENIDTEIITAVGKNALQMASWAKNLLTIGMMALESFRSPNPKDIKLYDSVKNVSKYATVFYLNNQEISMEEFIGYANRNK